MAKTGNSSGSGGSNGRAVGPTASSVASVTSVAGTSATVQRGPRETSLWNEFKRVSRNDPTVTSASSSLYALIEDVPAVLKGFGESEEVISALIQELDPSESGIVSWQRFRDVLSGDASIQTGEALPAGDAQFGDRAVDRTNNRISSAADVLLNDKDVRQQVEKAFRLFDVNNSGRIALGDLRNAAHAVNEQIDEQSLTDMIRVAGGDVYRGVSLEDFAIVMHRAGVF